MSLGVDRSLINNALDGVNDRQLITGSLRGRNLMSVLSKPAKATRTECRRIRKTRRYTKRLCFTLYCWSFPTRNNDLRRFLTCKNIISSLQMVIDNSPQKISRYFTGSTTGLNDVKSVSKIVHSINAGKCFQVDE